MASSNDWDLEALVRSCGTAPCSMSGAPPATMAPRHKEPMVAGADNQFLRQPAATLRDLDYLNLDHEMLPFSITPSCHDERAHGGQEVLISFPAASTSGQQSRKQNARNKPGVRNPRPKKGKKSQLKKVVCEVPAADGGVSTDLWAWRKYGQKPIKGSPYPRGYYKCSSLKACMARKLVERSPEKPGVLVVTYIGEHCHAVPTMINSLAGTRRHGRPDQAASPDHHSHHSDEASGTTSSRTVDGAGNAETPDDENALWPVDMTLLDDEYPLLDDFFVGPFDDDNVDLSMEDEQGGLGRRLSL